MKKLKHALPLYLAIIVLLITAPVDSATAEAKATSKSGKILGRVLDTDTGEPVIGTSVLLTNRFGGAMADTAGAYVISRLSPGRYDLRFSHVKYETRLVEGVKVDTGEVVILDVQLVERPVLLKTITVTPGRFTIMGTEAAARQSLTRQEIETMPQLGDDFFRAISRLPGVSANDFSTRFTVRGGEYEEVLVTFDGLRLYEPFHLKDFDGGAMSAVDVAAVEGIDLMTGGFPADNGDKTSGVFNITSKRPRPGNKRLSLGLSFLNARFASEGTFANNKGSWLVSARRGYIDLVLRLTGSEDIIKPTYYDVFAKTRYQLNRNHVLSANILHAGDDLHVYGEDQDVGDTLETKYDNSYAWLTLHSALASNLTVRTVGSVGRVTHDRRGQDLISSIQGPELIAHDEEVFRYAGLKTDWEWEVGKNYLLKFGVGGRTATADYDYQSRVFDYRYETVADTLAIVLNRIDSNIVDLDLSGNKLGAYVSNRFRLAEPLTTELGLRYDYTSYSGDECWSPRLNFVYNLGPATTIRTGWGYYYQTQQLDDLKVGDRQTEFYPAVRAEHRVIGFQHSFPDGLELRIEAYHKKYTDPWPSFRNTFDPIEAFPELESDRSIVYRDNTVSKGLEIFLKKDTGGKISWWASYALAKVEDSVTSIFFPPENVDVSYDKVLPSPRDQRHTFYFDLNYRPSRNWQVNLASQYHTGWPYTDVHLVTTQTGPDSYETYLQSDEQWSSRHKPFFRADLRLNRYFSTSKGRINLFVEIINVIGRKNVRGYNYHIRQTNNSYYLERTSENWFGILPSLGVSYDLTL